ncbi:MAG TPA: YdeI/OmpD-associated family protein [Polyangiaceae bacterium]
MKPTPESTKRFTTLAALEKWLATNHAKNDGLWIEVAKKTSANKTPTSKEILEVMLCWGWIDGQAHGKDEESFYQRYSPRKAKSIWSKINCAKAEELIANGRMKPSGLAQVEAAKKDGRWEKAYAGSRTIEIPDDLAEALAKNAKAKKFFATLDSQNRYAILFRLHNTNKAELRAKKLEKFVTMLAEGRKIHESRER